MTTRRFSATALIQAPAQVVYDIIADYRAGHPSILPKPPFVSLAVERGGRGAGTVIRVQMRTLGRPVSYSAVVTEPEPGRVLVETNDNGYVSSFTVESVAARSTNVTISTAVTRRSRLVAALECWFLSRLLRPAYLRELDLLASVASKRAA